MPCVQQSPGHVELIMCGDYHCPQPICTFVLSALGTAPLLGCLCPFLTWPPSPSSESLEAFDVVPSGGWHISNDVLPGGDLLSLSSSLAPL